MAGHRDRGGRVPKELLDTYHGRRIHIKIKGMYAVREFVIRFLYCRAKDVDQGGHVTHTNLIIEESVASIS